MSDLDQRYDLACTVAREAGDLMRRRFQERDSRAFTFKGPQDYVTATDQEVERLVASRIAAAFPADAFFGEEEGGSYGPNTWVIDPVDGTSNFARGIPHFCISIAFVSNGRPTVGAIFDPNMNELFAARRGTGATLNGQPMKVSVTDDIRRATIELGWSTRLPMNDYVAMLSRVMATGAGFLRAGSGALGLAYVAAGRTDGYGELHINAWDVLAGLLMVEEAGGWVNDFLVDDGLVSGNPVLACTPRLRGALTVATGIRA